MYFNSHLAHFGLATLCLSNIAVQAALVKAAPHVVVAESTSLEPRLAATAVDYLGVFKEILKAIGVFTEDQHSKAWEFENNKDMCDVWFSTSNGGNCQCTVECANGGKVEYNVNNACYVGGRNYVTDPRLGEFSITWTKKDSADNSPWEGEGLTTPILQVKNVGDNTPYKVSTLAKAYDTAQTCAKGLAGALNCHKGPWVCRYTIKDNRPTAEDRVKRWSCGVPLLGAKFPDKSWDAILDA